MNEFLNFIDANKKNNRPVCFFTLNDELKDERLKESVKKLAEGGFGGVYIHCRSGYTGEYLGEEWFLRCDAILSACESYGMETWIYDEFGWPSGIAGGRVVKDNKAFCQRWLIKNDTPQTPRGRTVAYYSSDGKRVERGAEAAYSLEEVVNASYLDVLNRAATEKFIEETYEKYRLSYGKRIKGFFTDEPQFGGWNPPWNEELEGYLESAFDDYKSLLPYLYDNERGGEEADAFRRAFFGKISDLFLENYIGALADWCDGYGYVLTGHILEEKDVLLQIPTAGDVMRIYRRMQSPAIDWLGGGIADMKTPKQVSSVCQRYGKKRCATECFALIGYGASFDEMKNVVDWQIAGGVSNICNIMAYSLRGRRKRDYPAGLVFEQPYYPKTARYNDYLSKLCTIPADMKEVADVLLVAPLYSAMKKRAFGFGRERDEACKRIGDRYTEAVKTLTKNHVLFHIASPYELLEAVGEKDGARLGDRLYKTVISLDTETAEILSSRGIGFIDDVAAVIGSVSLMGQGADNVYVSVYHYDGKAVGILKNLSSDDVLIDDLLFENRPYRTEVDLCDMVCRKTEKLFLPSKGLKVVLFDEPPSERIDRSAFEKLAVTDSDFRYLPQNENLLVLDFVDYKTETETGRSSVIGLFERLTESGYVGKVEMSFTFENRGFSGPVRIRAETPEAFVIKCNGKTLAFRGNESEPFYPLSGKNTVELSAFYKQDERSRKILCGELGEEGDFNMLGKLFELENVYVSGSFGVFSDDMKRNGKMVEATSFYVATPKNEGSCSEAVENGYPFYAGKMVYEKQIDIPSNARLIGMKNLCGATDVFIDDVKVSTVLWNEGALVIPEGLAGKRTLRIEHYNTLRNAIGPDHNVYDDGIMVGYTTFSSAPGWCDRQGREMWTDAYRLADFGVTFRETKTS